MTRIKGCRSWQELRAVFNAASSEAARTAAAPAEAAATGVINHTHISAFVSTLAKVGSASEAAGEQERLEYSRWVECMCMYRLRLCPETLQS
jgi:hypothetical protein